MQILNIQGYKYFIVSVNINEFNIKENVNQTLSNNDIDELKSIKNKQTYKTKKIGLYIVKKMFEQNLGWSNNDYNIVKNKHGKPFCNRKNGLMFNISHSGEYLIVGFSNKTDLGIDIEKHKKGDKYMNIANRFFHTLEIESLNKVFGEERERLFFDFWALKESYVKYVGIGIGLKMSSFYLQFIQGKYKAFDSNHNILPVDFTDLSIDSKYSSFLCTKSGGINDKDIKIIKL